MNMAWRNIWRRKRRTLVIITAVFIGVSGMVFLGAVSKGMMFSMVENSISSFTGHILIRNADFVSDPVLENRITAASVVIEKTESLLPQAEVIKRIRLDAVLNTARSTKGVSLVGSDTAEEMRVSFIGDAVIEGKTPEKDIDILIGRSLSEKIGLGLDKKVIISMQGAEGEIVSKAYRIKGIYDAGSREAEERVVFVSYNSAAEFLGISGDATEISVTLPVGNPESDIYSAASDKIKSAADKKYSVMSWREVMPALSSYLDLFDGFMLIWYAVVFTAMGFGIVNTVLMAVYERIREFGLMRALGMKWTGIFRLVIAETSFIMLIGIIISNVFTLMLVWYFQLNGLDLSSFSEGADMFGISRVVYPVLDISDILLADATVFVLGILIAVYPAYKACGFTPAETMRDM